MPRAEYFFTYRLLMGERTKRIGKGGVAIKDRGAISAYLRDAYPERGWDNFKIEWHSTEAAAFKAEQRKIDSYARATGKLPPWNSVRGGAGGTSYAICKARLVAGRRCRNLAVIGYGGYCGVHRR
jgi:hypothetical protein